MKVAHLILAHKAPSQLERLLHALAHPQSDTFIHLDKKVAYKSFAHLASIPRVKFTQTRLDVKWGGYSLTQAAVEGMREILQESSSYDFINLISGDDYPIKPLVAIHNFWEQHMGYSFLEYESADSVWWQANKSRVTQYHLTEFSFPGHHAVQQLLNRLLPRRKPPLFPTLYGGNMGGWYTLSRECATYVVEFVDQNPRLRQFARLTWGSDEFLVHSILLNSPLAATIINNNLRYIDWSEGGSSPKFLTVDDLPLLCASPRFFARKFDSRSDTVVLDRLDRMLQGAKRNAEI